MDTVILYVVEEHDASMKGLDESTKGLDAFNPKTQFVHEGA